MEMTPLFDDTGRPTAAVRRTPAGAAAYQARARQLHAHRRSQVADGEVHRRRAAARRRARRRFESMSADEQASWQERREAWQVLSG